MNSLNYHETINIIRPFKISVKRNLIKDIRKMILNDKRQKGDLKIKCPYCEGQNIVKNGKNKEVQRYLCKLCRKSFIATTNTPIYYSKKSKETWVQFVSCLEKQYSIRKTAKCLNISKSTAFFWRHKIFDAIRGATKAPILKGKVRFDKVIFGESFKGNHTKDGFNMPRPPYNSNTISIVSKISRERITVLTAFDSEKNFYIAPISIGRPSSMELLNKLGGKIEKNSEISVDSLYSYKILAAFYNLQISHKVLDDDINERLSNLNVKIKSFFKPYRGVATKYLMNYIVFFEYCVKKINYLKKNIFLIRGKKPFLNVNFKGRAPMF